MPLPDSSSASSQASSLEFGLAALKDGDYATAIAQLESTALPAEHPLSAKAQMGLVLAYAHSGDLPRAVSLCQSLSTSHNAQVKEWATRTLSGLAERYPQASSQLQIERSRTDPETPNTPLPQPEKDLTGFTPLEPSPGVSAADLTGFVPLESAPSDQTKFGASQSQPQRSLLDSTVHQRGHTGSLEDSLISRTVKRANPAPPAASRQSEDVKAADLGRSPSQRITAESGAEAALPIYQPVWRQAERAQGKSLGKVNLVRLLLLQAGTLVALFWMVQTIVYSLMVNYSIALTKIPFLSSRRDLFSPPTCSILIALVILFIASRWLLDGLLTLLYGLQPLSLSKLATYSPETAQTLQRFCRQRQVPMPALGVLPTAAPLSFSYGCLPYVTRTVLSQGLLEQLADDEIAAIVASEIGHISYWTVPVMSLMTVITQIPYTLYWVAAEWGNRKQAAISRASASLVAAVSYGLYALFRWVALWLSRQRFYYSDRVATELTGNPNGLTRALLKIAIGTAKDVQTQRKTSYLLEGFDLLTPLGYQSATSLGSTYPYAPAELMLEWDWANPYRHWLAINSSHPPAGDRLNVLALYARHWKLAAELDISANLPSAKGRKPSLTPQQWRRLLVQGAPFFGLGLAAVAVYLLSTLGWVGSRLGIAQLAWMYRDHTLLQGLPLVGFSLGTFIRINRFFPDSQVFNSTTDVSPPLTNLLKNSTQIPIDSVPVRLEGTLIGRAGISNFLSQDLLLQTATGIIRLHGLSQWGPIGNLLPQVRPTDLIDQKVTVIGWFRRGVTPWIDVETLRTPGGRTHRSNHPVWSTILGTIAALWGIYIIFRGGF